MVKVGDRVKVLSFAEQPQVVGMEGTVIDIADEPIKHQWPIWVHLDEQHEPKGVIISYPDSCFTEDELEVIS